MVDVLKQGKKAQLSKIIGRGKESQVILCVKQGDLLHTDGILIHVSLAAQETLMT